MPENNETPEKREPMLFKPVPGTEIPLHILPENEARWLIRIYCIVLLSVVVLIPFGVYKNPGNKDSVWFSISKALEENFSSQAKPKAPLSK